MDTTKDTDMTIAQLRTRAAERLTPSVGADEARAMARGIVGAVTGMSPVRAALAGTQALEPETVARAREIVGRVIAGEPLQYVLGHAYFVGMELQVTPDVLIPRPETAQLVDLIVNQWKGRRNPVVIDVCTGSGCIAIALTRALPFASVTATDISAAALAVAAQNVRDQHVDVKLERLNALNMPEQGPLYDIIVSNPPYIAERERADMSPRVYAHEPAIALFVPDSDPLLFYRAIARWAAGHLSENGALYFEINPLFVTELRKMLADIGFGNTDIVRDFRGNYRFAICRR